MIMAPDGDDVTFAELMRDALLRSAVADAFVAPPGAASPIDRLLDLIVRTAARVVPAPEGALFLVDPQQRALSFEVVIGRTALAIKHLTVPLGHGIAGLVAVSGQPLAVANAQQDPRHARDIAEQAGYFPTTILAVPVTTADGAVTGVLELLDRQGAPTFSLADMELLGLFAQLVSVALEMRRAHRIRGVLIGQAIAELGGLPAEVSSQLDERLTTFSDQVAADPAAQRALALSTVASEIAARGEAEERVCSRVLTAFADYLRDRPAPGAGLGAPW